MHILNALFMDWELESYAKQYYYLQKAISIERYYSTQNAGPN